MRLIGAVAMLLLVGGLATDAPAGDDAAAGKKAKDVKVYTEEEWIAKVRDIQNVDVVGVKRADLLKREASKSVVRMRVKIWEIRATKDGPAIDVVDVAPTGAAEDALRLPRDPIVLPPTDGETVAAWQRWDRLSFKVTPKVAPDGALLYTRDVRVATDIDRTPNPGVEYPPNDDTLGKQDGFRDWVERYARACAVPDWKAAWRSYSQARALAFPVTATARDSGPTPLPRGASNRVFDIRESTGTTNYGLLDPQGHPRTWASVPIADPQICEALKSGAKAELRFHVMGLETREDLEVHEGRFRVNVTFGRLK